MNLITNKKLTKTLMLIVVFVMIFTFILPNYSLAKAKSQDEKDGGKLFRPIAQLLAFVADLSIELAQQFL